VSIIEKEFIKRILVDESKRFNKNQGLAIQKLLHFRSGELFNGREFTVSDSGAFGAKLTLTHPVYERFLDMNKTISKRKGAKSYPIHNRFVMGHYGSIASRLMNDMTNDVVIGIKKELNIK
jgi:hypothetical protein